MRAVGDESTTPSRAPVAPKTTVAAPKPAAAAPISLVSQKPPAPTVTVPAPTPPATPAIDEAWIKAHMGPGWNPVPGMGNVSGLVTDTNGNVVVANPGPTDYEKLLAANNAVAIKAGTGGGLDTTIDVSTNGLGVLMQVGAAQLDPTDLSDPTKRRAILSALGATDLEIRDLGYRGVVYDDELQAVAGVPQYTKIALNKIAGLRVLDGGKVVPSSATNTGSKMTAGQYYWRNALAGYQAEQSAKANGMPTRTPLPTRTALPTSPPPANGSSVTLTILAIGAAFLVLS